MSDVKPFTMKSSVPLPEQLIKFLWRKDLYLLPRDDASEPSSEPLVLVVTFLAQPIFDHEPNVLFFIVIRDGDLRSTRHKFGETT
jgi:hypothetical protein